MHEDWLKVEEAKLQTANGEGPSSDASQEPTASSSQEEVALEDGVGSEPQSVEPEVQIPNSNLQASAGVRKPAWPSLIHTEAECSLISKSLTHTEAECSLISKQFLLTELLVCILMYTLSIHVERILHSTEQWFVENWRASTGRRGSWCHD